MPANMPGSLPVKTAAGAYLSTNPHSALHDQMYDEIVAIATESGTDFAGTFTTLKARLAAAYLQPSVFEKTTTTAVAASATYSVSFDVETQDVDGWGTVPATSFTCPATGFYHIIGQVDHDGSDTGEVKWVLSGWAAANASQYYSSGRRVTDIGIYLSAGNTISLTYANGATAVNITSARILFKRLY